MNYERITITEFSKRFNISRPTVYKRIKNGVYNIEEINEKTLIVIDDNVKTTRKQSKVLQTNLRDELSEKDKEIAYLKAMISDKNKMLQLHEREAHLANKNILLLENQLKTLKETKILEEETLPDDFEYLDITTIVKEFANKYSLEKLKKKIITLILDSKIDFINGKIVAPSKWQQLF